MKARFVVVNDVDDVVRAGVCEEEEIPGQARLTGERAFMADGAPGTHYFDGSQIVAYTDDERRRREAPPFPGQRWSAQVKSWISDGSPVDVNAVRAIVMQSIKRERDTRIEGGFVWDGSPFDSDTAVSQPRLLGLFTTAIAGGIPPEGYPWRLKNNTWRVLSAVDAQQVWGAFQTHMAAHFAAFAAHEAAVLAETDIEVLRSYDTEAGWP